MSLDESAPGGLWHQAGASVTVELDWDVVQTGVEIDLLNQGVSPEEIEAWMEGALLGVRHALEVARAMPCVVKITEIFGDARSTTATLVAAASAFAVWEALEYTPPDDVKARIDTCVNESRGQDPAWLADFAA